MESLFLFLKETRLLIGAVLIIIIGVIYFLIVGKTVNAPQALLVQSPDKPFYQESFSPPEPTMNTHCVFHIDGAVKHPGVYTVTSNPYLYHAVELAGGLLSQADLAKINLAATLQDRQKVMIPFIRKRVMPSAHHQKTDLINLNLASAKELSQIPGIGPSLAKRIIAYRSQNGFFTLPDQLKQVKGIGHKKFEKIKTLIFI